jgi:pimeloyl-ACP methyl ester carboxylesterase
MTNDAKQELLLARSELPLTVKMVGSGRPVLVLHGGHGPGNTTAVVDHFAPDWLVVQPTHPGWDGTPRPDWFNGIDDLAVTYLDLLEDRKLDDVVVVATSFGGWIASEMAVRDRGHRISRMILIDPVGPEVAGQSVQVPEPDDPDAVPSIMDTVYVYGGRSLRDPKLLRRVRRVQIPVLMLWGENDTVVTPEFGRVYAAGFADARFEVIPATGHMPLRDAPETVFGHIDAFLADK